MWRDHGNGSSQIATKLRHTAVVVPRAGGRLPETAGGGNAVGPGPVRGFFGAQTGLVASVSAVLYAKMAWTEHGSDRSPNCASVSHQVVRVPGHGPFMVFWLLSGASTSAQAERSEVCGILRGRFPRAGRHDGLGRISLLACGPLGRPCREGAAWPFKASFRPWQAQSAPLSLPQERTYFKRLGSDLWCLPKMLRTFSTLRLYALPPSRLPRTPAAPASLFC